MKMLRVGLAAAGLATLFAFATPAMAGEGSLRGRIASRQAPGESWHGYYYDPAWGMPVALIVPPTAEAQTHYSLGVGGTRVTTIRQQFRPGFPGPSVYERQLYLPAPAWPVDTDQFGVYYVRGPWGGR